MNKHLSHQKVHHSHRFSTTVRFFVLALIVAIGGIGISQQIKANAVAIPTADEYCSKYTINSEKNACKDGIRGQDCNDYAITFDQATADICTAASKATVSGTPGISLSPSPSSSTSSTTSAYQNAVLLACAQYQNNTALASSCLYGGLGQNGTDTKPKSNTDCLTTAQLQSSPTAQSACITGSNAGAAYIDSQKNGGSNSGSNSTNPNALQDILDQSSSLTDMIDLTHAMGPDAKTDTSEAADNNYGSYVNGAGKQQPIKVYPGGQPNGPAIVYFNGGGWHGDDGTSDSVATGGSAKNNGNGPDKGAPAGGGATARGYTSIEVTYRLGSSSVYYAYEDVMRGLRHVINNAGLYGIDAGRIAVFGDSAGGSLSMRVATSGKSGAKAAVGWSAPTNAYTGLFKSYKSFLIGMDHSTCVPTDLAGMTNFTDLLNGGSGDVAQYGQGLSSNDFSGLGIGGSGGGGGGDPLGLITQVMTAAQYAQQTGQNAESISKQLESGNASGGAQGALSSMSGGVFNLASKKLGECLDNMKALSPALYASPDSPPAFLAGFDSDDIIDPSQLTGMAEKLNSLGIRAESLILPGDPDAGNQALGASDNHLGYDPRFVCPTLNFLDSILQPDKGQVDCKTGVASKSGSAATAGGGGGAGGASDVSSLGSKVSNPGTSPQKCGGIGASAGCSGSSSSCGIGAAAGCKTTVTTEDCVLVSGPGAVPDGKGGCKYPSNGLPPVSGQGVSCGAGYAPSKDHTLCIPSYSSK
jgi:acetyl esterase/lipase